MSIGPTSTGSASPDQPRNFDPVAAGREIDALHDRMEAAFKRGDELHIKAEPALEALDAARTTYEKIRHDQEAADREGFYAREKLTALLVEAKANVANFKAFVLTHTHISYSTAKRILGEAAGQGEHIREQSRKNTAAHRARQKALTTADVRATDDGDNEQAVASNVVAFPAQSGKRSDAGEVAFTDLADQATGLARDADRLSQETLDEIALRNFADRAREVAEAWLLIADRCERRSAS
ncbi:MAG TPA: hypothetical protein VL048_03815 [Xanthobacteraceae bacterium]|nr:hypothetical protein [Xanthobacteraceae bacterium]